MWGHILISSVLLLPLPLNGKEIPNGAFCRANAASTVEFPLDVPDNFLTPWVWDAIYDKRQRTVEVTTIGCRGCYFNHTLWQMIIKQIPQHKKNFAYGLKKNIYVDYESPFVDISADHGEFRHNEVKRESLTGERLHCLYYLRGNPVARSISTVISGMPDFMRNGAVNIVCPTPRFQAPFDEMRLMRNLTKLATQGLYFKIPQNNITNDVNVSITPLFPVCKSSELLSPSAKTSTSIYQYSLTVCTATARTDRAALVEWIEYHKLLGVDHFFIYLTSEHRRHRDMVAAVSDYIEEGTVTLVPWAYKNCVEGMAGGRSAQWVENGEKYVFLQPKAISQTAALASCYSRYKRFSPYMMHIDDDEFIALDAAVLTALNTTVQRKPSGDKRRSSRLLFHYAREIFRTNPGMVALSFKPVRKFPCPNILVNTTSNLPRIGKWIYSTPMVKYEGKLLMTTKNVKNFYVHYVSQLVGKWKDDNVLDISTKEAALLHFKADDIFGKSSLTSNEYNELCSSQYIPGKYREGAEGEYVAHKRRNDSAFIEPFVHMIDATSSDSLRSIFGARMHT